MAPKASRAAIAPRVESLEGRALLSVAGLAEPTSSLLVGFVNTAPRVEQAWWRPSAAGSSSPSPRGRPWSPCPRGSTPRPSHFSALQSSRSVRFVERDGSVHAEALPVYPNDPISAAVGPGQPQQRRHRRPRGVADHDRANPATIVAVIDSGIDLTTPRVRRPALDQPGRGRRQSAGTTTATARSTTSTAGTSSPTPRRQRRQRPRDATSRA